MYEVSLKRGKEGKKNMVFTFLDARKGKAQETRRYQSIAGRTPAPESSVNRRVVSGVTNHGTSLGRTREGNSHNV